MTDAHSMAVRPTGPPPPNRSTLDLRAERTRVALRDALLERIDGRDLDGLSVAGLCRSAGVHRTTFYGHYPSAEAFAVEVLADLVDEAASVDGLDGGSVGDIADAYYATLGRMLDLLARRRGAYRSLFRSSVGNAFREALRTVLRRRLDLALDVLGRHDLGPTGRPDLATAFLAGALASTLEAFVESDRSGVEDEARVVFGLFPPWWPRLPAGSGPS